MFNSRNLLVGLVAASVSFGVGNDWSKAIAQSAYSTRYLSDQEIRSLEPNFEKSLRFWNGFSGEALRTYSSQINRIVNMWQKSDPSIPKFAPFLGTWMYMDDFSLHIYPSMRKGQVCIVGQEVGYPPAYNFGTVQDDKLVSDGELGKIIITRKTSSRTRSGKEGVFLAKYSFVNGKKFVLPVSFPEYLGGNFKGIGSLDKGRFTQMGCMTSFFPIEDIGKLSTGERILKVPRELMSRSEFKEALKFPIRPTPNMRYTIDGEPIIYNANQPRLFLFDGKRFKFVGYDIDSIFEFKVSNQIYWATRCAYNAQSCSDILVSEPNFVNTKIVRGFDKRISVVGLKKDNMKEGFFYADTVAGNGRVPLVTYLVNLNLTVADANRNVLVCEAYRAVSSMKGSQITRNSKCQ